MDGESESRELSNKRRYAFGKYPKRENGWLVGYPDGGFIQKYLGGDVGIAWRRAEGPNGEAVKNGFIIKAFKAPFNPSDRNPTIGNLWLDDEQSFVLPLNIELMDGVQHSIPAIVSFCAFDRGRLDGGYPIFAFEHVYGSEKLGSNGSNGEVGLAVGFFAIANQQRGHQEIKGGAGGVDDSSHVSINQRIKRDIGVSDEQFPRLIGRIRLGNDFVWAAPLPYYQAVLQDWDLGFGPIYSGLGA